MFRGLLRQTFHDHVPGLSGAREEQQFSSSPTPTKPTILCPPPSSWACGCVCSLGSSSDQFQPSQRKAVPQLPHCHYSPGKVQDTNSCLKPSITALFLSVDRHQRLTERRQAADLNVQEERAE